MPMAQQNARFLMSSVKKIASGKGEALKGTSVQYLYEGFDIVGDFLCHLFPITSDGLLIMRRFLVQTQQ